MSISRLSIDSNTSSSSDEDDTINRDESIVGGVVVLSVDTDKSPLRESKQATGRRHRSTISSQPPIRVDPCRTSLKLTDSSPAAAVVVEV